MTEKTFESWVSLPKQVWLSPQDSWGYHRRLTAQRLFGVVAALKDSLNNRHYQKDQSFVGHSFRSPMKKISNLSGGMQSVVWVLRSDVERPGDIWSWTNRQQDLILGSACASAEFISEFSHDRIVLISTCISTRYNTKTDQPHHKISPLKSGFLSICLL